MNGFIGLTLGEALKRITLFEATARRALEEADEHLIAVGNLRDSEGVRSFRRQVVAHKERLVRNLQRYANARREAQRHIQRLGPGYRIPPSLT